MKSPTEEFPFKRIGLTGGIAAGKSTVAELFREHGIPVLDADQLVRQLSAPGGAAHAEILQAFGTADRKVLRERIYQNPKERKLLESILHPKVAEESARRIAEAKLAGKKALVYEAALLIETGRYRDFDEVIVVVAPQDLRINRLMARDGSSRQEAEAILQAQLSDEERERVATFVIQNTGTAAGLAPQVDAFLKTQGISP